MKQQQSAVREEADGESAMTPRCCLPLHPGGGLDNYQRPSPWLVIWWDCGAASRNSIATHLITNDIADLCCQFVSIIIIPGNVPGMAMWLLWWRNTVSCLKTPPQTRLFFNLTAAWVSGGPSLPLFICFQSEFLIAQSVQCWFGSFRHIHYWGASGGYSGDEGRDFLTSSGLSGGFLSSCFHERI